jgi:hypothetical protein
MEPDFVTTRDLTIKFEAVRLQLADDFLLANSWQARHQAATTMV